MTKRTRRRSSPWRIVFLLFFVGSAVYINQFIVPNTPAFAVPTSTPTRSPESFINEAESFFDDGKFQQAVDSYQQAIHADPMNKANYVAMGRVQAWAGLYDEALESVEMALIGNENYAMAHAVRGWVLGFQKEYLQAEIALKRALDLEPNNAVAHAYFAEILINQGNAQRAIDESRKAYELAPNTLEVLRARGYILYLTDNREESIEMYQAAIAINDKIPDLWMFMGYNYKALGDYDAANEMFMQANILNPSDPVPDLEISRVLANQGFYGQAVQWAENAVNDDPTKPSRHGWLGFLHLRTQDYNAAIQSLSLAVRGGATEEGAVVEGLPMDYDWAQYYWYYGLALARTTPNRCAEAVPIFQALLNAMPDYQPAVESATQGLNECQEAAGAANAEGQGTNTP